MKKIAMYCCFLMYSYISTSQVFPVQVIQNLKPPYSSKIADYGTSTNEKWIVNLILTDVNEFNRKVKLNMYIETNNLKIKSSNFIGNLHPIYLNGGVLHRITNLNFRDYFLINNLQGITPQLYSSPLPDGLYQFCIEVLDYDTNQPLSRKTCLLVPLILNDPPFLNYPSKGEIVTQKNPQQILFNWTPRHLNATAVQYEFTLKEIWDNQINPQAAFLASPILYQTTTHATTLLYGPAQTTLLPDKIYAWQVRALVSDGISETSVFRNNGYSEISHFNNAVNCNPPTFVLAESDNYNSEIIRWQGGATHVVYNVQYRKKDGANDHWFEANTTHSEAQLRNLEAGTTYEFRAGGKCSFNGGYSYSQKQEFLTSTKENVSSYNCGIPPNIALENQDPLAELTMNETFTAGDFPITVTQIISATSGKAAEKGSGYFSGFGYTIVPYLGDIKIQVAFKNIKINTSYQMIKGVVVTEYDKTWLNVADLNPTIEALSDPLDFVSGLLQTNEEILGDLVNASEEDSDSLAPIIIDDLNNISTENNELVANLMNSPDTNLTLPNYSTIDSVSTTEEIETSKNLEENISESIGDSDEEEIIEPIDGDILIGPISVRIDSEEKKENKDRANNIRNYSVSECSFSLVMDDSFLGKNTINIEGAHLKFQRDLTSKKIVQATLEYNPKTPIINSKIGFIDATVKKLIFSLNKEGDLTGHIDFKASTNEDSSFRELFVVKKGLTGYFSYSMEYMKGILNGEFSFNKLSKLNVHIRSDPNSKPVLKLENASIDSNYNLKGQVSLLENYSIKKKNYKLILNTVEAKGTYNIQQNKLRLTQGHAKGTIKGLKKTKGKVGIDLKFHASGVVEASIDASNFDLSVYGFQLTPKNISLSFNSDLDSLSISASKLKVTHDKINGEIVLDEFKINQGELTNLVVNGNLKYKNFTFLSKGCDYSSLKGLSWEEVQLKISKSYVEVDDFSIDTLGTVSLNGIKGKLNTKHIKTSISTKWSENEISGSFTGKIFNSQVGGTLILGADKNSETNFSYGFFKLNAKNLNTPLFPGVSLTRLGGQFGYNGNLKKIDPPAFEPKNNHYVAGLSMGIGLLNGTVELAADPVVAQFGNDNFKLNLNAILAIPANKSIFKATGKLNYIADNNFIEGSIGVDIKIPHNTGSIFKTTASNAIDFKFNNKTYTLHGSNLGATFLKKLKFRGGVNYTYTDLGNDTYSSHGGLDGSTSFSFSNNFIYQKFEPLLSVSGKIEIHFNSLLKTAFNETSFEGNFDGSFEVALEGQAIILGNSIGITSNLNSLAKMACKNNSVDIYGKIVGELKYYLNSNEKLFSFEKEISHNYKLTE